MIVDRIEKFLRSQGRSVNEAILQELSRAVVRDYRREFMQDQWNRAGRLYATRVTKACARQSAYDYLGFPTEPDEPREIINRRMGSIIEMVVFALARQSGCDIERPYKLDDEQFTATLDGISLPCWSDGLVHAGGTYLNVEIKSLNGYVFDRMDRTGKIEDQWGYLTQCSMEILAWRQKGAGIVPPATCYVGVNKVNGKLREWFPQYDESLVRAAFDRAKQVKETKRRVDAITPLKFAFPVPAEIQAVMPPRAYAPVEIKKGRLKGKLMLGTVCSYCKHHDSCYDHLLKVVFADRAKRKPIFLVPMPAAEATA